MTVLAEKLAAEILASGPLSVARYMAICLLDPKHGYYTKRDPLGAAGDFTTAPEISQMFGELIGLWLAQVWLDQGARPFTLAELGPGRGTLMADILRATARIPGFHEAATLHLVEASPTLRKAQDERLPNAKWCDTPEDLPTDAPLFVISNEFFDALPIRQFVKAEGGWQERQIGFTNALTFGLTAAMPMPLLDTRFPGASPGTLAELNPSSEAITATLAATIGAQGGAFLAIDYGVWDGTGDTLQALANHAFTDPLNSPGQADITAHVAFRWLAEATPLRPHFTNQAAFLQSLGIAHRAQALSTSQPERAEEITSQLLRLTDASEMGTLFKALALLPHSAPLPPGFPS